MSDSESDTLCMAGPTIEWLEPKLPDLLKNGTSLPSLAAADSKTDGGALERITAESQDCVGVGLYILQLLLRTF